MADEKISQMVPAAGLVGGDLIPIVHDIGAGVLQNQYLTGTQLNSFVGGSFVLKAGDTMSGDLNFDPGGGVTTILGADGSASFGTGILTIDSTGNINTTGYLSMNAAATYIDATGYFQNYRNDSLTGNGIVSIVGFDEQTVVDVSIGDFLLYVAPPNVSGLYEFSASVICTSAATSGNLLVEVLAEEESGSGWQELMPSFSLAATGVTSGVYVASAASSGLGALFGYRATVSGLVGSATYIIKIALKRLK